MDASLLEAVNAERRARRAVIQMSWLDGGKGRMIREGDRLEGDLATTAAQAFRSGKSALVALDGREAFFNVYLPSPRLVVIGAVHIAQALAPMAKIAGYPVEIIDPRTAFATAERFGDAYLVAEWPETALGQRPLDAYCAVAAVTHDPKIDDFALKAALDARCFYVGALGSRKTHAKRVERLAALGLSPQAVARISAPIGLDIGASSPAEIAVAILGDVIRAFRSRGSGAMDEAA